MDYFKNLVNEPQRERQAAEEYISGDEAETDPTLEKVKKKNGAEKEKDLEKII